MEAVISIKNEANSSDEIAISCYLNEIPPFIEADLVRLYNTLHCSLQFFHVFRSTEGVSSYVVSRDNQPIVILLFRNQGGKIEVLNEMLELDSREVQRFARYVFSNFTKANIISFKAVKTHAKHFPFPVHQCNAKDTYVITLPDTPEKYASQLGKSTRTTLKYQMNKLVRECPSFATRFDESEEIEEQLVLDIIRFSQARIASKASGFSHDAKRILALAKQCGFVHVMLIDGRVCAGTVNYRIGSSYFGEVTGYDQGYEKFGIGKLTVYLTICESIRRGGKRFYMGGGRFEFKERMLGVRQQMDRLEIYRSYGKLLLNFDKAAEAMIYGHICQLKAWLHKNKERFFAKLIFNSFYFWRGRRKLDR